MQIFPAALTSALFASFKPSPSLCPTASVYPHPHLSSAHITSLNQYAEWLRIRSFVTLVAWQEASPKTPRASSGSVSSVSSPECLLPTLETRHTKCPNVRTISPETLADLLAGHFNDRINGFQVVDCRFPYEYTGGCITGAINLWTIDKVLAYFYTNTTLDLSNPARYPIIFYCEFSSHRAPTQCHNMRYLMSVFSPTFFSHAHAWLSQHHRSRA